MEVLFNEININAINGKKLLKFLETIIKWLLAYSIKLYTLDFPAV
jgi:hypothetical protein